MVTWLSAERGYYLAQVYPAGVAILTLPYLLRLMGEEGYAVIAFGNVLFIWAGLLDFGFGAALSRQMLLGGQTADAHMAHDRRAATSLFMLSFLIGLVVFGGLGACGGWIATHWLGASASGGHLQELEWAVLLLALALFVRWLALVPRAVAYGRKQFTYLAWHTVAFSSVRQLGCLWLLDWLQGGLAVFLGLQLVAALLETVTLVARSRAEVLPKRWILWGEHLEVLRSMRGVALPLAGAGALWLLMSQTDRLALAFMLDLNEYGRFSVAIAVASAIPTVIAPLTATMLPRLMDGVRLARDESEVVLAYRRVVSQLLPLGVAMGAGVAVLSEHLLLAWTGDESLAAGAAPILAVYALGNGIQVVSGLPYFLQYAKGDLRLHLLGNAGFALVFLGVLWAIVPRWGAVGAGWAWLLLHSLYSIVWVSYVHRCIVPAYWRRFLWLDVAPVVAYVLMAVLIVQMLASLSGGWPYILASALVMALVPLIGWWRSRNL